LLNSERGCLVHYNLVLGLELSIAGLAFFIFWRWYFWLFECSKYCM